MADSTEAAAAATVVPAVYSVHRSQDGAQVRAELSLDDAQAECAMLNAQARVQVGTTPAIYDRRGGMVRGTQPIYGSMFHGQVSCYEIRSADGLVI